MFSLRGLVMLNITLGQLLIDDALPEDMRGQARVLDKKGVQNLLQEVAERHPEKYNEISHKLMQIGHEAAYASGGYSFGISDILPAKATLAMRPKIRQAVDQVLSDKSLTQPEKEAKIIEVVGKFSSPLEKAIMEESVAEGNPLAKQIVSGAKGSPGNLKSLRGGDLLYLDHRDQLIPIPVLKSYSEGLTPAEYFAGTYGARKGLVDLKLGTAEAGFLGKQLIQAAHRLVVTADDSDKEHPHPMGIPSATDDSDNEGALLAHPAGPYSRNTHLTNKVLSDLKHRGIHRILVRTPMAGGPSDGGVYAKDVGFRERGSLPPVGDYVGITAAQSVGEPLTQTVISSKHSGGVGGANKGVSGFKTIDQIIQVPKTFRGGASHAQVDGRISGIDEAPQGGQYVSINDQRHYVQPDQKVTAKIGQVVEAGDMLSEGLPNPAEFVKHKGIGEGRRLFVDLMRKISKESGFSPHRRNLELLATGLINHVHLNEEMGDHIPGDVVPYSVLANSYRPRKGSMEVPTNKAIGKYLEQPVLHYSIGTPVRPSVEKELKEFGVKNVVVHHEPPPFEPVMIRGQETLSSDQDWMTRFLGSNLEKHFLRGVHRMETSDISGTSYVPALAEGLHFGEQGKTKGFKPVDLAKPKMPE